jgi:ketosteroid isomerase-like protein
VSDENVEVVRRGFEALGEGGVEALIPLLADEFEVTTPSTLAAEPDTYRGHDGIRRYFDSFYEAMDEIRFQPHDFVAVGERVVVPFKLSARGRSSGLEFDQSAVMVWRVRDGRAVALELFTDLGEALEYARSAEPGEDRV